MREFKVGDKVKIIDGGFWTSHLNGKIGVIIKINDDKRMDIDVENEGIWNADKNVPLELLTPYPSIHITTDGRETHAVLKEDGKVIKKSVAKCSKDDEFSFETGAKIAVDRLFEEKKDESNFSVIFGEDSLTWITIGNVYDFKDGRTVMDNSVKSIKYNNFGDFKRCNSSLQPFEIKKANRRVKEREYIQVVGGIKSTNTEGKTTQSGDICIQSKNHYGGYFHFLERFKNIDNDMEIFLTNVYDDTPEYIVLEGYEKYIEYIEERKKKNKFKPHLRLYFSEYDYDFYGNIGDETYLKDVLGNDLKVGDTVSVYKGTIFMGEYPVFLNDKHKKGGIMGIADEVFIDGKSNDWTIIKNRSYTDVENRECVNDIKYIKTQLSKGEI